jgi:dextranase
LTELLPTKATFVAGDAVEVEVRRAGGPVEVTLWQLERKLDEVTVSSDSPIARFGTLAAGGYGVECDGARTALDVLTHATERLRYGFVSSYEEGRDAGAVADNVRRLHLNAVQFYDWMYRHACLLPPHDDFEDALGRRVSLATVRRLVQAVRGVGSLPLGYAAVYAVGREHWDAWRGEGLYRADGTPWMLGDFLWNVDPSSERWLDHFRGELVAAAEQVGFAGFHLDQFGAPKRAMRIDGKAVDLAEAFPVLIDRVRAALPSATLLFNNVNDFPTWSTAPTRQDAVYIEVWSPHDRLDHLGGLVAKARALAPEKPVCLAAYLSVYAQDPAAALSAMRLELATVFSHGGTCLLHGEEDAILTDPYYVDHRRMDAESAAAARDFYDFAVRYGDLLFDRGAVDVTRTHSGGVNKEIRVDARLPVSTECSPGSLWARAVSTRRGLVVSLIDLTAQADVDWDAPKHASAPFDSATVSFERQGRDRPQIFFACPDAPGAVELETTLEDGYIVARIPAFRTWALVWAGTSEES